MAKTPAPEPEVEQNFDEAAADAAPLALGFHVFVDGASIGVYPTENDAQCFIDQHVAPQGINATIVEVEA